MEHLIFGQEGRTRERKRDPLCRPYRLAPSQEPQGSTLYQGTSSTHVSGLADAQRKVIFVRRTEDGQQQRSTLLGGSILATIRNVANRFFSHVVEVRPS